MVYKNMDLIYTALKLTQSLREVLAKFLTYLTGLYTPVITITEIRVSTLMHLQMHLNLCMSMIDLFLDP